MNGWMDQEIDGWTADLNPRRLVLSKSDGQNSVAAAAEEAGVQMFEGGWKNLRRRKDPSNQHFSFRSSEN